MELGEIIMEETIHKSLPQMKGEIRALKKKLNLVKNRIDRYDDALSERVDDEVLENRLKKARAEKRAILKELKPLEQEYDELLSQKAEIFAKELNLQYAKDLDDEYEGYLSNRADRSYSRFYTYITADIWEPTKSTYYYLCRAYIALRLIESKKFVNKYLKFSDEFLYSCGVLADLVETEINYRDTAYVHRRIVKRIK